MQQRVVRQVCRVEPFGTGFENQGFDDVDVQGFDWSAKLTTRLSITSHAGTSFIRVES